MPRDPRPKLTEPQRELAWLHMDLIPETISYALWRHWFLGIHRADVQGAAHEALCRAAADWSEGGGASFKTWFLWKFRGQIDSLLQKLRPLGYRRSRRGRERDPIRVIPLDIARIAHRLYYFDPEIDD